MGKRLNIGVYIGPDDMDIAAWFNLLQAHHMSRSKWVRGLLAAYALNQPLSIGTVNLSAPLSLSAPKNNNDQLLFGVGSSQSQNREDRYGYGWHIRGPNREFIYGSVINVSISKDEILPIINEVWANGHQVATFIKALIRQNLKFGSSNIPPKLSDLQKVYSDFIVSQIPNKMELTEVVHSRKKRKPSISKSKSSPHGLPTNENSYVEQSEDHHATTEGPPKSESSGVNPGKTIHFPDEQIHNLEPKHPMSKNPLLDEI